MFPFSCSMKSENSTIDMLELSRNRNLFATKDDPTIPLLESGHGLLFPDSMFGPKAVSPVFECKPQSFTLPCPNQQRSQLWGSGASFAIVTLQNHSVTESTIEANILTWKSEHLENPQEQLNKMIVRNDLFSGKRMKIVFGQQPPNSPLIPTSSNHNTTSAIIKGSAKDWIIEFGVILSSEVQ
ncbi:hypothetical protein MJT46_009692 [Ovis ammon polii x Ovis aries]|nr:hypothetical protein MJT46_009692 [Ovis ammon polii x Ovis aries]